MRCSPLLCALPLLVLSTAVDILAEQPPPALKHPVTDVYHGQSVLDDYRWLENIDDPQVKAWVEGQNRYTRSILDKSPMRARLTGEVQAVFAKLPARRGNIDIAGGRIFATEFQPPREQPRLIVFVSLSDGQAAKVVLDPLQLDPSGGTRIDFYVPSRDGRYVAVSLSRLGSEAGDLHVFEVDTGKELASDQIARVNGGTAGGSAAWNADGTGIYYTRYPRAGEREGADVNFYQQIWFHRLGSPAANDKYEAGRDFPRIAEIQLKASDDGKWILATVANGDGGDFYHLLHGPDGGWRRITSYSDQISGATFGPDDALYFLSRRNAPMGKLLRLAEPTEPLSAAKVVVPESGVTIEDFAATRHHLYVVDLAGGPSQLRMFTPDGRVETRPPVEGIVSISGIHPIAEDDLLYSSRGYIQERTTFRYSPETRKAIPVPALSVSLPVSFEDCEVVRDFAVSKDGTRVPLNIIRRRGTKLDGTNPVLLTGYGGYNISLKPQLEITNRVLLDHGFVLAEANLRGGGEFGEKWHLGGNLTHKQNVFDDFYACAQYLVSHRYTTPERLAIIGASNGGLLMGAALTQHPEMYRAVVTEVGIYDMLRVELSPNGAFNVTEFGTVKELDQFRALYAYSPYHHVSDDASYPAVLFETGDNDPRVDPANSRKMVARLQAVGHSKGPILLRTSGKSGHGASSFSEAIAATVDSFSFLFDQLGVQ